MSMNCPECTESWAADECLPQWPQPDFKCQCLDLTNSDHLTLWNEAWRIASSYVFNCTGQRWPGKCLTETVRPCVPPVCPKGCECYDCGRYSYLNIDDAFCWPVCEITSIDIAPNYCQPEAVTLTAGNGFRLERVMGCHRIALEDDSGCCGNFPRQDLCKPLGEDCTWSITALTGCNPPPEILRGTAALACDIAQECIDTKCGLPRNVSTASFSGVTVNFDEGRGKTIDVQILRDLFDKYSTDDRIVEQFLNPCQPVTFHHVDGPRHNGDTPEQADCTPPSPVLPDLEIEVDQQANPIDSPLDPLPTETEPLRIPDSLGIYRSSPVR